MMNEIVFGIMAFLLTIWYMDHYYFKKNVRAWAEQNARSLGLKEVVKK